MRPVVKLIVIAVAVALLAAGSAAAEPNGAGLYAKNCLECHGVAGHGVTDHGPPLRGAGALAADFYLRTGYMPLPSPSEQPRRRRSPFSDPQIAALVRYVASLGRGPRVPTPDPERGDMSVGQRLFTEHCAGCHQAVAEGGYVTGARVPPLKDATARQIAEAVRIGPYLMPSFPRSQLTDRELDSVVAYVEASKKPDDPGGWGIGHVGPVPEGLVAWLIAGTVLVGVCVVIGSRSES
jgi:quinol---cytochrome-c reductase cytochrome c subunit